MFRPNRIGTPVIWQPQAISDTNAFTLAETAADSLVQPINVINGVPVLDFGYSSLRWQGPTVTLSPNFKCGFGQQIVVTEPIAGDTVGIELNGSIYAKITKDTLIVPFFGRIDAPLALLAPGFTNTQAVYMNKQPMDPIAAKAHTYQTQIILNNGGAPVAGTYVHGFMLQDDAGGPMNQFQAAFSVRQLNDQQDIGYRDTLR